MAAQVEAPCAMATPRNLEEPARPDQAHLQLKLTRPLFRHGRLAAHGFRARNRRGQADATPPRGAVISAGCRRTKLEGSRRRGASRPSKAARLPSALVKAALFELLAAPAGTRIIPSDIPQSIPDRLAGAGQQVVFQ